MLKTVVLVCLVMASASAASPREPLDIERFSRGCDELFQAWDRQDAPGMAVLVQLHGQDIYKKCFGLASLEHTVPITPETSFDLASCSKHITGLAILLLQRDGKLDLDDDIRQYFPEFALRGEDMRIGHLLYQMSGIWEFWTILTSYSGFNIRDYITMSDMLTLVSRQEQLNFAPGERYEYTNTNYSLLAEIVARATGVSFGEWTSNNIFEPLGMKDTGFQEDCTRIIPNVATAYLRSGDQFVLARPSNVEVPGSAHAFTTLNDMAKWIDNFRTERVGGPGIFGRMTTPGILNNGENLPYAAGLLLGDRAGQRAVYHSGQTGGYKTMVVYCPEEELGVVILANERSIDADGLSSRVLDIYFGTSGQSRAEAGGKQAAAESTDERQQFIELGAEVLDKYVGGYSVAETGQKAAFYRNGENLVAGIVGLGREPIFPLSEYEFSDASRAITVVFQLDSEGRAERALLRLGDDEMTAQRINLADNARTINADVSGLYYSDVLGTACSIAEKNGRTYLTPRRYNDMELTAIDGDNLVSSWGFISLVRDESGRVAGFNLTDEIFGFKDVRFSKVHAHQSRF